MKKNPRFWQMLVAGLGTVVLVLSVGSSAWSQPAGMLKNYGSAVSVGEYEGTLRRT